MIREIIFGIVGGLGLFLFGMKLLSEGLQKVAGNRLRRLLKILTNRPIIGILGGAGITALIQSSSATTVMTVGFINAGLMTLRQGISMALGAAIGTTITAQIIAFKIDACALPAIGIGFAMMMLGRRKALRFWGETILGFGILFLGMYIMKTTLLPLRANPGVKDFLINFSRNPILGVFAGALITMAVQSSSATVGLTMALAVSGLIDFTGAICLVLGENIGTTITAIIASIGTNVSARRVAISHSIFKIIGVVYMLIFIYTGLYQRFIDFITPGLIGTDTIMRHIANAHTVFNVFDTIVWLPMIGLLKKISTWIVPGEVKEVPQEPRYLESHLLDTPSVALDAVTKEIIGMVDLARDMVKDAMRGFFKEDKRSLLLIPQKEDAMDRLQVEVTNYLVALAQRTLTAGESGKIPALLHSVNDIERIGDHTENFVELAERKIEERLPFTKFAISELNEMLEEINTMLDQTAKSLTTNDPQDAEEIFKIEDEVNNLTAQMRQNHIQRLDEGKCKVLSGVVFLDMLYNFEKIGDHLTNVAQAVKGRLQMQA